MGILADTFSMLGAALPERKVSVGSAVKVAAGAAIEPWQAGKPQQQREAVYRYMVDGYSTNEVMYACIEELATSAAEPRLVAINDGLKGKKQIPGHPITKLFGRPNPFVSRYDLVAGLITWRFIAGNAYVEKVRSGAGKVAELWPLRPDRMWVLPDPVEHIRGWEYRLGGDVYLRAARDVTHVHTRLVMDDYYGMPPARPAAMRIDTATAMRAFTQAFFTNSGVPAGILTLTKSVSPAQRQVIQDRYRNEYGGPTGWHGLAVLDATEATYTPMGLPLGERGLVMPDLDEIIDAKTAMVFGVPLELIGARLGMMHGNRSTMKEARATFWDETLMPLYQELSETLTSSFADDYGDFDYLEFDLSTVRALQEDESAKVDRVVKKLQAALCSVQEGRAELGYAAEYEPGAILVMPDTISGLPADQLDAPPAPAPMVQPAAGGDPQQMQQQDEPPQQRGKAKIALLEPRAIEPPPAPVVNVYQADGARVTVVRKTVERDADGLVTGVTEYHETAEEAI